MNTLEVAPKTFRMALKDFYTIGQSLFDSWSPGYGDGYLKVLPHPDVTIPYTSAWQEWQKGQADYENGNYTYEDPNGLYYSSWGPESDVVELELNLSAFNELFIPGLGKLIADNTSNDSSYDDNFQFYNGGTGSSQGPLIVVDPGDTIKIKLINDLPEDSASIYFDDTNLHTHGLHVSAQGNSDNVLVTIDSGTSWDTEIKVPDDHFVGPDWYHPHLHGATNVQVSKGLAGPLLIQPSTEETDDLDNFNPV
ncbi:MAG: multicopper oxidase domain-containing protein, partial [Cyanobacteriota bacterium]|nr:multicopper oxidase domain-containing protein [Cyanobacteriota bacterium]